MYHGVDGDLRNLYRRNSGLTLRRFKVLVAGLPPQAHIWALLEAEQNRIEEARKQRKLQEREQHHKRRTKGGVGQ